MEGEIKKKLVRYRIRVERMVARWKKLGLSERLERPTGEKWSFTETMVHLELVQEACLKSMQERLGSGIRKPSSWKYTWRFIRLRLAMKSRKKFKAPAVVLPPADESIIENWTPENWLESLNQLETFFDQLKQSYRHILLFRHPLAGPMTARHALIFLMDHLDHHERNLREN